MTTIAFVDHTAKMGGAELSLARFLRQTDLDSVALVVLSPESLEAWNLPSRVTTAQTSRVARVRDLVGIALELRRILQELDPAVIVVNSYSAAQYVAVLPKRRRRYVFLLRQEALPKNLHPLRKLFSSMFTLRRFDTFISNSRWTESTLPAAIQRRAVHTVLYPVSGITAVRSKSAGNKRNRTLRLLSLSRLSPWKGVHVGIEAVRLLHERGLGNIELTIAGGDLFGEPEYSDRLRVAAAGLRVEFVGHQSDVSNLLANHDVLLCLSSDPEPFGQVVVQGLAWGLVVLATNQGGPAEIIANGKNGILVKPESPNEVANELRRLLDEPQRMNELRKQAAVSAHRYLDEETTAALAAYLTDMPPRSSS